MQKSYKLEGLDCASCADKIEKSVQKIHGVEKARVDFMAEKMTLEVESGHDLEVENEARAVIGKLEPDVKVISLKDVKEEEGRNPNNNRLIRIIIAFVLFLALIIIKPSNNWVALASYLVVYVLIGGDIVKRAVTNIFRGEVFDENFLMSVATIGAFFIGEYPEAVAVMLFYQVGEWFQSAAVDQSRKSIAKLMDIRPDSANLLVNGQIKAVAPDTIEIGQQILVKPGEKVPLDGQIIDGSSMVDTSALTGESVPRTVKVGDEILGGFINKNGALTINVTKKFGDSTVSKILDLVENASSKKAPAENFISKFARYYTPVVVVLAVLLAVIPPFIFPDTSINEWVYRALTFLVISCPCALVISVPLSFFGGIGGASKLGVLIKGSNYLEILANTETIVFDKTGTLTKGNFVVQNITSVVLPEEELLRLTATAEQLSTHPIAISIKESYGKETVPATAIEEVAGHGIKATIEGKTVLVGNAKLMKQFGIEAPEVKEAGTLIFVAIDNQFAGYLVIADQLKPDAISAIKELKAEGVKQTVMLTGDNQQVAEAIAKEVGVDKVYAELLPDGKVDRLEELLKASSPKNKVAFVGDGMNDAPVLARADVGIAMGGLGSDAAIEAADVVIMNDEPSRIASAIKLSRKTLRIVKQNIIFAIAVKIIVLVLGALGLASMQAAVFADVGVTIIAVLNAMRCLRVEKMKDNN
ncbi:heavy metal translocating P-type ATPase [Enterococcus faecalis]|uniref:heavy metal translocating P-type ATPase n=1 Tax=Enterococcus TaxID=1350 RepID=UPI00032E21E7|nr:MULTISPECIES: heavy metal translocating P-type ATPase [Enterococcus]HAP4941986.1 cadmium-translocating P-type ATPase [Enterococcus faecalis ADL-123]EGO2660462.1 cadmium-translocating P-type ATPase [Enterococcus faecalis]EGO2820915.1 cadmium-translocating P-type ATPase [Enterococcus faecalis]EGO6145533.1 cadmium-translocating P-type ATPase [Enterococcus faecalis]EGO6655571.1 cadmium-translocating P-type ATPase [Enterococcus faecalis]